MDQESPTHPVHIISYKSVQCVPNKNHLHLKCSSKTLYMQHGNKSLLISKSGKNKYTGHAEKKKKIFHIGEYFRASLNGILKDSGFTFCEK